jgi:hypothetical protein
MIFYSALKASLRYFLMKSSFNGSLLLLFKEDSSVNASSLLLFKSNFAHLCFHRLPSSLLNSSIQTHEGKCTGPLRGCVYPPTEWLYRPSEGKPAGPLEGSVPTWRMKLFRPLSMQAATTTRTGEWSSLSSRTRRRRAPQLPRRPATFWTMLWPREKRSVPPFFLDYALCRNRWEKKILAPPPEFPWSGKNSQIYQNFVQKLILCFYCTVPLQLGGS